MTFVAQAARPAYDPITGMSIEFPRFLTEPPGDHPRPPVETAGTGLPFGELAWEDFERLCFRLARLDGNPQAVRLFGTRGQAQSGIDIFSRSSDGSYVVYQCKRMKSLAPSDLRDAVAEFQGGSWFERSSSFVLCTSASCRRTELAEAIEALSHILQEQQVRFEVWDSEHLSLLLKDTPEVVLDFFGPAWLERFCRPSPHGSTGGAGRLDPGLRISTVCRFGEASWRALGIAPSNAPVKNTDGLATFVRRPAFGEALDRVHTALKREGPTVVVLTGKSAAGKTRLAYETLLQLCPGAWLIAPASPDDARRLYHPRDHLATRQDRETPVVLWLDDVETFTRSAGLGLTTAHISQLHSERRPVVIMCTAGGKGLDVAGKLLDDRSLADLLALGGTPIVVDHRLGRREFQECRRVLRRDIPESIRAAGIGAYLVGASRVADAWATGRHEGASHTSRAVVAEALCLLDGAIAESARLNWSALTEEHLRASWITFRGPERGVHGHPNRDAFELALEWCSAEVAAGQSLLTLDRQQSHWQVSDVLRQHIIDSRIHPRQVAKDFERAAEWMAEEAANEYDHRDGHIVEPPRYGTDRLRAWLGVEHRARLARRLGRRDVELRLYEESVGGMNAPHPTRVKLAVALLSVGEDERAASELHEAVASGDIVAMLLSTHGQTLETKAAQALGSPELVAFAERLADVLELASEHGVEDLVSSGVEQVIASGGGAALSAVGQSMVRGHIPDMRFDEIYAAMLERGSPRRCGDLGEVLVDAWKLHRAVPLLRRAAESVPPRRFDLGDLLAVWPSNLEEATNLLESSAELGDPRALQSLAALYALRLDRSCDAEALYRRCAAVEHVWAFDQLADFLERNGSAPDEEPRRLRDRAAELRAAGRGYYRYEPLFLRVERIINVDTE